MQDTIKKIANPAPLGLVAFGATTILLNLVNAGMLPLTSTVVAMGIFFGGAAQVVAGIMAFNRGDVFPATAFTAYGFFWLTLVFIWSYVPVNAVQMADSHSVAAYLFLWGLFTAGMTLGTCKAPVMLRVVFITLTILFFLLALGDYTGNVSVTRVAGIVGLICGFSAFYTAIAEMLHESGASIRLPF